MTEPNTIERSPDPTTKSQCFLVVTHIVYGLGGGQDAPVDLCIHVVFIFCSHALGDGPLAAELRHPAQAVINACDVRKGGGGG